MCTDQGILFASDTDGPRSQAPRLVGLVVGWLVFLLSPFALGVVRAGEIWRCGVLEGYGGREGVVLLKVNGPARVGNFTVPCLH